MIEWEVRGMSKIEKLTAEYEGIREGNLAMSEKRRKAIEILEKVHESLDENGIDDRFDTLVKKIKNEIDYINSTQEGLNEETKAWHEKTEE